MVSYLAIKRTIELNFAVAIIFAAIACSVNRRVQENRIIIKKRVREPRILVEEYHKSVVVGVAVVKRIKILMLF
jgi:hypothetical protein